MSGVALFAQTWLVVVTGLSGTPAHRQAFDRHAAAIVAAARSRLGVAADQVIRLGEGTTPRASTEALTAVLADVATRAGAEATVVIVLIGHGSAQGGEARLNLPGPDLTPGQLDAALDRFPLQELVVVNAASTSGPWIEALAGPRRTIITATRSATERDETVFPRYLAAAFASDDADTDKDGRLSVLELFEATRAGVEQSYREGRQLRTEHALLDDNGDGRGSLTANADSGDGRRAALLRLGGGATVTSSSDPALRPLLQRRDSLERVLAALRGRQATMDEAAYTAALERLLLDIAETGRAIRARQGAQP